MWKTTEKRVQVVNVEFGRSTWTVILVLVGAVTGVAAVFSGVLPYLTFG